MPKAQLSFNLPEETQEHMAALKAQDIILAVDDFRNWLRGNIKYTNKTHVEFEEVREKLFEFINNHNVGEFF